MLTEEMTMTYEESVKYLIKNRRIRHKNLLLKDIKNLF